MELRAEIARNFDAFQRSLAALLPLQRNRFALLRHGAVIAFFDGPGAADEAGARQFTDGLYSIQQVTDEPVELGLYANAQDCVESRQVPLAASHCRHRTTQRRQSNLSIRVTGLLDTGATGSGIRGDLAEELQLAPKGQRRVHTANGLIMASEFLIRIGFASGDYTDPDFVADQQQPYVLESQILGFELQRGFGYPLLIGMDVIGTGDLSITRDGRARFVL